MKRFHPIILLLSTLLVFSTASCCDDNPELPRQVGLWEGTQTTVQVGIDTVRYDWALNKVELFSDGTGFSERDIGQQQVNLDTFSWALIEDQARIVILVNASSGFITPSSLYDILTDEKNRQVWEKSQMYRIIGQSDTIVSTTTWDLHRLE